MGESVREDLAGREADTYSTRYLAPHVRNICAQLKAGKVLDLGCGNGSISRILAEQGCRVWGCDVDRSRVEMAARRVPSGQFKLLSVYADPAELGETGFDLVIACEVIEHLYFPRKLPEFARSVLAPQGHLLVTTPYHGYLKNLSVALSNRWDSHHGVLDDGGHIKFFSRPSLTRLLAESGFEVVSFRGAGRMPWLWKSMILLAAMGGENRLA